MRAGIAVRVALGALVLASAPGLARLVPDDRSLDRATFVEVDRLGTAPAVSSAPPPAPGASATPASVGAGAPSAVAMTPPPADLHGELAPAGLAPTLFAPSPAVSSGGAGEVLALVIGIDDYPGSRADLSAAVADADTIDAALARFGVPAANRVVLRDGQARRSQVVEAVRSLVARSGPRSTVVLAYAGHVRKLGPRTEALVTADGGLITDQELADLLAPAAAERMWLVLATCFGGGFTEALAPGRVLTAAADAGSLAYESPELNASFLVHHMVREGWLEGRAGPSVQAAFAYADARLAAERPERRPHQVDQGDGPLVLGPRGPQAPTPQPPAAPAADEPSPPPTTTTTAPDDERSCLLGVALCRRR